MRANDAHLERGPHRSSLRSHRLGRPDGHSPPDPSSRALSARPWPTTSPELEPRPEPEPSGRPSLRLAQTPTPSCPVKTRGLELRSSCVDCDGRPHRTVSQVPANQVLFLEGARSEHVFPVLDGYLKESRYLADGRSVTLRLIGPGDVVGTESLFNETYQSSVESLTLVQVCAVPREVVDETLGRRGDQARAFRELLERNLQAMREQLVLTNGLSAEHRVLEAILRLGRDFAPGAWFKLPLSRAALADYLGLAVATVSRALGRLEGQGTLEVKGRSIRILQK